MRPKDLGTGTAINIRSITESLFLRSFTAFEDDEKIGSRKLFVIIAVLSLLSARFFAEKRGFRPLRRARRAARPPPA